MTDNKQVVSDRELLELAAKAAGYTLYPEWDSAAEGIFLGKGCDGNLFVNWNPLTDDGDALRLAAKLMMEVRILSKSAYAEPLNGCDGPFHETGNDVCAATRRCITRAAASLAKGEKS